MKRTMGLLFILLLLSGLTTNSFAGPRDDPDRPLSKEDMERIRERVETVRMWRLTKALNLDEKTSSKLFPLLSRYDKRRGDLELSMASDMRELRKALQDKKEGQLKAILDRLEQEHILLQGVNDEERTDLKKMLSVEQQANYLIFQQDFSREMRRIAAETRERSREKRRVQPSQPERP